MATKAKVTLHPRAPRVGLSGYRTHGTGMEGPRWSAKVWIDGEEVAEVNQDGDGGGMRLRPWSALDKIEAIAKELPKVEVCGVLLQPNADMLLEDIAMDIDVTREFDRRIGAQVLFLSPDGKEIRATKRAPAGELVRVLGNGAWVQKTTKDGARILNLMPRDEALLIFRRVVG
jgi:hypothetical protein